MAKISRRVRTCTAHAETFARALDAHRDALIEGLMNHNQALTTERQLGAQDFERFLSWLSDSVQQRTQALEVAERACASERSDEPSPATRRDRAATLLASRLTQVRARLGVALGARGQATYGLGELPPQTAAELADYASVALTLLRAQPLPSSGGRATADEGAIGEQIDIDLLAEIIEDAWIPLRIALDDLDREQRAVERTLARRDGALATWSQLYHSATNILASLAQLADVPELVHSVEPALPRPPSRAGATTATASGPRVRSHGESAVPDPVPSRGDVAEGSVPVALPGSPAYLAADSVPAAIPAAARSAPHKAHHGHS
ncbi:MAG: hypothetical protein Tsb0020_15340 [Haliangiales bacterium]